MEQHSDLELREDQIWRGRSPFSLGPMALVLWFVISRSMSFSLHEPLALVRDLEIHDFRSAWGQWLCDHQPIKHGSRPPWVGLAAAVWLWVITNKWLLCLVWLNANDIGESVGLIPGIACNKFRPWAVLLVGAVMCFVGYFVLWLAVSRTVVGIPYCLLWIALVIATNSNAWFGTAVLVIYMRNFPLSRGTIAGILKGYVGISAAVYTVVYSLLLKENASKLLLFLAFGIPFICLSMMYFIRPCVPASGEDSSTHVHFIFTQAGSILLAIYLVIITFLYDTITLSDAICYILVRVMILFMTYPLGIPIKMTFLPSSKKFSSLGDDSFGNLVHGDGNLNSTQRDPLLTLDSFHEGEYQYTSDTETLLAVGEGAVKKKRKPRRGEDVKFYEAFIKADFWLLWGVHFLGVGSGVTVLNNLAQIGISFGVDDTTILLCLFSFCNFLGRLGSGVVSEHLARSRALPRTILMKLSLMIMVLTFLLYAFALNGTLYLATALVGICFGIQYVTMVPTVSELFGLKNFGVIYNFMLLGNPVGALIFSGLLAGYVYDTEAVKQGNSTCIGPSCLRLTFLVLSGMCGVGTVLSVILTIRIRPVYKCFTMGVLFILIKQLFCHKIEALLALAVIIICGMDDPILFHVVNFV
ncbi:hypothetical protein ACFE04_013352 [Oxalis oulophora]